MGSIMSSCSTTDPIQDNFKNIQLVSNIQLSSDSSSKNICLEEIDTSIIFDLSFLCKNNEYNSTCVVLSVYNTIVTAYFVEITKQNCPFSRPRLVNPENGTYLSIYIPVPKIIELERFHIDELSQFQTVYKGFKMFIGICDDLTGTVTKNITDNNILDNLAIVNINKDDDKYLQTVAIDFSSRFIGMAQCNVIINGSATETNISVKQDNDWKIFMIPFGYMELINILRCSVDENGTELSLEERIIKIDLLILNEIDKLDKKLDVNILNKNIYFPITGTGTFYDTLSKINCKNYDSIINIINLMNRNIDELRVTHESYIHMPTILDNYNNSKLLCNLIIFSEILKYFKSNIECSINIYHKNRFSKGGVHLNPNWILGKILIDNKVYKI